MDRCLLLLSDVHDVGARRRVHVIVAIEIITIDTQQLHNSLGMLDDCLSDRGVGLSELLDQRLHKRRVLLHKFTELRDLRVGLQCAEIESWCGGSSTSTETGTRARATGSSTTTSSRGGNSRIDIRAAAGCGRGWGELAAGEDDGDVDDGTINLGLMHMRDGGLGVLLMYVKNVGGAAVMIV